MNEFSCPHCQAAIPAEVTVCPACQCRTDAPVLNLEAPKITAIGPRKRQSCLWPMLIGIVLALLALQFAVGLFKQNIWLAVESLIPIAAILYLLFRKRRPGPRPTRSWQPWAMGLLTVISISVFLLIDRFIPESGAPRGELTEDSYRNVALKIQIPLDADWHDGATMLKQMGIDFGKQVPPGGEFVTLIRVPADESEPGAIVLLLAVPMSLKERFRGSRGLLKEFLKNGPHREGSRIEVTDDPAEIIAGHTFLRISFTRPAPGVGLLKQIAWVAVVHGYGVIIQGLSETDEGLVHAERLVRSMVPLSSAH